MLNKLGGTLSCFPRHAHVPAHHFISLSIHCFYTGVSLSLINLALSSQVNFPCYAAANLLSSFTISSQVRILGFLKLLFIRKRL